MGSALHIPLPSNLESGASISVKVTYSTSTGSTALQWLDKKWVSLGVKSNIHSPIWQKWLHRQTKGKAFPFLFSQCQSIYCRTLAPVQDTPSVKAVRVNPNLSPALSHRDNRHTTPKWLLFYPPWSPQFVNHRLLMGHHMTVKSSARISSHTNMTK